MHVVFGAGGPLGDAVARAVLARHGRVRAVNRRGAADLPPDVEVVRGDATNPDSTREICRGASLVYHCAGAPYTDWPAVIGTVAGLREKRDNAAAPAEKAVTGPGTSPASGPVIGGAE